MNPVSLGFTRVQPQFGAISKRLQDLASEGAYANTSPMELLDKLENNWKSEKAQIANKEDGRGQGPDASLFTERRELEDALVKKVALLNKAEAKPLLTRLSGLKYTASSAVETAFEQALRN